MDGQKYFPDYSDLVEHRGVKELAEHAQLLGIQFKIGGFPFGAQYQEHCKTFGLTPPSRQVTEETLDAARSQLVDSKGTA